MSHTSSEPVERRVESPAVLELKRALELELTEAHSGAVSAAKVSRHDLLGMIDRYISTVDRPDHEDACRNLGHALGHLWEEHYDELTLKTLLEVEKEILALNPIGHSGRAWSCSDLAVTLRHRFMRTGDTELLAQIIQLQREALDLCPAGHPDRSMSCCELAVSLQLRYQYTGENELLNEAIGLQQEALDLRPVGHSNRAAACGNLAFALKARHKQTGDSALIDRAIELEREAVGLYPVGDSNRATACNSLALALKARYQQTQDHELLQEAIKLEWEALDLCPTNHPDRSMSCNNLAASLSTLYHQTDDSTLLDQVIRLHKEALQLRPAGHPDRPESCNNVSATLATSYMKTGDSTLLDEAIALEQEALLLTPPGHPERWRYLWGMAELTQMRPSPLDHDAIMSYLHEIFHAPSFNEISQVLSGAIGTLLHTHASTMSRDQQHTLLKLFASALDTVALAAGLAVEPATQLHTALHGTNLSPAAVKLAIRMNELSSGLELLERARGVLWSHMLRMRNLQLERVPDELAAQLRALVHDTGASARIMNTGTPLDLSARPERHAEYAHRNRLQDIMQQIRSLPGLGDFMHGPTVEMLMNAAMSSIVVVLVAYELESHALIIPSANDAPILVPLPGITRRVLRELTFTRLTSQKRGADSEALRDDRFMAGVQNGMLDSYSRLAKVWRKVVKPVIKKLNLSKARGRARPRIHWCPTGLFAFVPVHAAGIYQGADPVCCSEYFVSSYTPTLAALLRAQEGQRVFPSDQIRLLAVAAEYAHDARGPPLPNVPREVRTVLKRVKKAGASGRSDAGAASTADVIDMIKSANLVHFACHGNQHASEPHESHFCLTTGNLSVADLTAVALDSAFFAFLSACETAKGDQEHAEEIVHLAATMLFAGFKSVVATMWAMRDEDGPFIAKHFYKKLFKGDTIDVTTVPYALDAAITALRESGASPERWATFIHMGA